MRRREVVGEGRRREVAELAEEGEAEGVRVPGPLRSMCGAPVKPMGGLEGARGRRWRENGAAEGSPAAQGLCSERRRGARVAGWRR
jgi:hypothetical protein